MTMRNDLNSRRSREDLILIPFRSMKLIPTKKKRGRLLLIQLLENQEENKINEAGKIMINQNQLKETIESKISELDSEPAVLSVVNKFIPIIAEEANSMPEILVSEIEPYVLLFWGEYLKADLEIGFYRDSVDFISNKVQRGKAVVYAELTEQSFREPIRNCLLAENSLTIEK